MNFLLELIDVNKVRSEMLVLYSSIFDFYMLLLFDGDEVIGILFFFFIVNVGFVGLYDVMVLCMFYCNFVVILKNVSN